MEHLTDGQDVNLPKNYNQDDLWRLMQYHVGALMCCKKLPNQLARKLMKRLMDLTYRLIKKKGKYYLDVFFPNEKIKKVGLERIYLVNV